ncbi:nuclear pore complex protein Nup85-like [Planoprotostelium fungivorum]|uniref:Nuclear pore complex protein Nup85 n=1 Tax=Planoprotostelium fungivorum TaxID=1890364 RepID=A0A2P6NAV2_9EUKA|nr:nuclear pore complex protein Nup85-like [Planoprotostelium fungivorum]
MTEHHAIQTKGHFLWGIGDELILPPKQKPIRWNIASDSVSRLIAESYVHFMKLQRTCQEGEAFQLEHNLLLSSDGYRTQYQRYMEQHLISENATDKEVTAFLETNSVWHLAEIFLINTGDNLVAQLTQWFLEHECRQMQKTITEIQQRSSPSSHPDFWDTIARLLLNGQFGDAASLLSLYESQNTEKISSFILQYPSIPDPDLTSEFDHRIDPVQLVQHFNDWHDDCQLAIQSEKDQHLSKILHIMLGDENTLLEVSNSWYELVMAKILYQQPDVDRERMTSLVETSTHYFSDLTPTDEIYISIMQLDAASAMLQCYAYFSSYWLVAHMTDLLFKAQRISSYYLEEDRDLRVFFLLEYAGQIVVDRSMWEICIGYQSFCNITGLHHTLEIVDRIEPGDERKFSKLMKECDELHLKEIKEGIYRSYIKRKIAREEYGGAVLSILNFLSVFTEDPARRDYVDGLSKTILNHILHGLQSDESKSHGKLVAIAGVVDGRDIDRNLKHLHFLAEFSTLYNRESGGDSDEKWNSEMVKGLLDACSREPEFLEAYPSLLPTLLYNVKGGEVSLSIESVQKLHVSYQLSLVTSSPSVEKDPSSITKRPIITVISLGDNHKSPKGTIRSSKDITAPLVSILNERGLLQEETKMDKEKMVNSLAMNTIPIQRLLNSIHLDYGYFLHAIGNQVGQGHLGIVESQSKEEKDERDLLHLSALPSFCRVSQPLQFVRGYREGDLQDVRQRDVSKRHSNSCDRSHAHCHMCNFNKGMLHHSFSIAPAQSTKECALSVTCRQTSTASSHGNKQEIELCFCTCLQHNEAATAKSMRPQAPVLPPVVASPTTQRQSPLHASPLPPVTVRTTENTPVVDVVHAAQVPNMAPSAVAQPPIILTELQFLAIRQVNNLHDLGFGRVRLEDLSDGDRQEINRITALRAAASSRKAKQGHDHKSFNKSLFILLMNRSSNLFIEPSRMVSDSQQFTSSRLLLF